jgi:hypothetical protein
VLGIASAAPCDHAAAWRFRSSVCRTRYPEFTIADHARGVTFYWEHLGLLDDPGYRARWDRKRAEYLAAGIKPWQDGGGPEGTLIETRDETGGGLDAAMIAKLIEEVLLG